MNRHNFLEKLLDGEKVARVPLWQITSWDKKFKDVPKDWQPEVLRFKHVSAKKLKALVSPNGNIRLLSTGKFTGYTNESLVSKYLNEGEVLAVPTGGTANIKYHKGKFVDSGNLLCSVRDNKRFSLKFLFYYFLYINHLIQNAFRGSGVKHPQMPEIMQLPIPIPCPDTPKKSLAIQAEIVRILDTFTELTARQKQYSYYRDRLLTFSNDEVAWLPVAELFHLKNGYTPSKSKKEFWQNGKIPWFRMDDIRQNGQILNDSLQKITEDAVKGGKLFSANSMIFATSATIGEHALITVPYLSNQRFTNLTVKEEHAKKVDIKYLYYYGFLLADWCKKNTTKSSFASVDMAGFRKFQIPIPCPDTPKKSLAIQAEIVRILDTFDTLTHSINEGLPREIALRQKQYQHYRDQLLDFPKVGEETT